MGDGKEFNTILIYPNYINKSLALKKLDKERLREIFSSMIISVNSFLSPFERIINYVIIHRDFSLEKNELTNKGSYKRNNIIKNFSEIISPLYKKTISLYEIIIMKLDCQIGFYENWELLNLIFHGMENLSK